MRSRVRATVTLLGCAALLAGCDEACASSELDVLADSVWLELLGVPRCDPPAGDPLPRSSYLRSFDEERDAALELAVVRGVSELTLYGLGDALRQDPGAIAAFVTAAGARGV